MARFDLRETIEKELSEWDVSYLFDRGGKHPYVLIENRDGAKRRVYFAGTPSETARAAYNARAQVRQTLREMGAKLRLRRDEQVAKLIDVIKPEPIVEPMTAGPADTEPPAPPTPQPAKEIIVATATEKVTRVRLSQAEVGRITRLVVINAEIDDEQGLVAYKEGWSDERILKIMAAMPGRNKLTLKHIAEARKRTVGMLQSEKESPRRAAAVGNGVANQLQELAQVVSYLESELARLETRVHKLEKK